LRLALPLTKFQFVKAFSCHVYIWLKKCAEVALLLFSQVNWGWQLCVTAYLGELHPPIISSIVPCEPFVQHVFLVQKQDENFVVS
jgi:hypothetical protein